MCNLMVVCVRVCQQRIWEPFFDSAAFKSQEKVWKENYSIIHHLKWGKKKPFFCFCWKSLRCKISASPTQICLNHNNQPKTFSSSCQDTEGLSLHGDRQRKTTGLYRSNLRALCWPSVTFYDLQWLIFARRWASEAQPGAGWWGSGPTGISSLSDLGF